jgi:SAM-dependent methyltransferase
MGKWSAGNFDDLVMEGFSVPVEGWDFSWFRDRGTEQRPPWGYARLMDERMSAASRALDLQTGGGEVLAGISKPPPVLVATEGWPPNVALARRRLAPIGGEVVVVDEDADLPFADASFDLIVSRHPVTVRWHEVARVLSPGGTYLSQQIGAGEKRELREFMVGPRPVPDARRPDRVVEAASAAGLDVVDLRTDTQRVEFFDVAAVIVFLRKVIWHVPDLTVEKYWEKLLELHHKIEMEGPFVTYSKRFLIEARKPPWQAR